MVFMDVQIPEMDGLEATRCIRQKILSGFQNLTGLAAQPRIIAMTANAMQGDREVCLEAGMDDYISKPIRIKELVAALQRCQPLERRADVEKRANQQSELSAELDPTALDTLMKIAGDANFFADLIASFLTTSSPLLTELRQASEQKDATRLKRTAHTLKSGSADFGAMILSGLCKELEMLGKAGTLEGRPIWSCRLRQGIRASRWR